MKYFLTFLTVMLVIVFLVSTATAADTQKRLLDKATVVDQVVQDDRPQQAQDPIYTVYPVAKKKGPPMHGDYTIGMTGVYSTFFDALTALNTDGMDGDVNLLVQSDYDATILGETFPITFRATIPGSGTFKITVKPAPGATAIIASSAFYTALVNLDSIKNMEFDGFNGTDNFKLSIVANGTRATTGRTVNMWNGCQFIDFKNMVFQTAAGGSSPNWRNIDISGKNTLDGGIKDVNIDNCQFADNGLGAPEVHIYISGYNAFDYTERVNVTNCEIYNWNGLGTFTGAGIQVRYGVKDCLFENNELYVATPSNLIEGGLRGFSLGGTSDVLENITIKDNNIHDLVSTTPTTTSYAIQLSGPTTTAGLAAPKNIVIDGNTITNIKGTHTAAISATGIIAGNSGQDVIISNNLISDIGGGGVQPEGIRVGYSTTTAYSIDNCQIIGNTVDGVVGDFAGSWVMGIQTGCVTNLSILKNKVTNINSSVAGNQPIGILLFGGSGKVQTAQIANNFVYFPTASATVSDGWRVGIFDYGYATNAADIYYNSVYIGGTNFDAAEATLAFNRGNDNVANVMNNIFYNARGGAGLNYGAADDALGGTLTSNFNDIYANPGVLGYVGITDATTLGEWQTLTGGQDMNSISEEPTFVSTEDLHIKTGTATGLSNAGTPVAVLDDIDGDARGLGKVAPDIGADEFENGAPGAFALVSPANSAIDVAVNGDLTWDASQFAYSYDVYLDKVDATTLVGNVPSPSYTYAGLDGISGYFWKVVAKNDIAPDAVAGPYSFTTAALPPNSPSDILFSNVTTSGMDVSWTDNSLDENGFKVYTATVEAGPYTLAATVGADVITSPVSGLAANTRYYFRVTAYHTVQGESDPATANVATLANVPTAPRLSLATRRSISVRHGLADNNNAATLYAFYNENESKWVTANNTLGDTPVWRTSTDWNPISGTAVKNLFPSISYVFKAKAKNLDGVETDFSPTNTLATLAPFDAFPVTEGFETAVPPTDWEVLDVDNDYYFASPNVFGTWGRAATLAYKGVGAARYLYEYTGANPANDWLFNQPFTFTAGTNYILSFYVRTGGFDENLKVTIGDAPTPAAQTTVLGDYPAINMTAYTFKGIVFTVPTTGTYYIGFYAYSGADQNYIRMDEVKVAVANPTDVAFLGLTQINGIRPMKAANVGQKTEEIVAVPFDRSKAKPTVFNKPSNISNTLLVTGPVNTSYELQGFLGQDAAADAFNNNNGILKATPSPVNLSAQLANIGVSEIPGFTINYSVDDVAQPSYTGGAIPVGSDVFANIPFAAPGRGMFDAVAAAEVVGEGDPSNDTLRVPLMIYPTPSYNLRYDNYGPNSYVWGTPDPYADAKTAIGMRYTNTVRGRVGQIDILTNSNRRSGSTYLNVIVPEVWTITVRAAGPNDDTPGPILYTKQFSGPKYNTLASTVKTLALGDDAPVIEAGQNFWVTATAESIAVTTGGFPFGLYAFSTNAASLLPGAQGRSYGSDYVIEDWYAIDAAIFGPGDWGHWPMRTIMVPVSNSISGVVYHDLNGNGSKDVGEPALEGWEVKITGNLELSTLTNVDGIYEFNALENGTFTLSETIQSGWACVTPDVSGEYTVVLAGSESVVRDFGNFKSTTVSGIAWTDLNHNGSLDPSEVGKDGVEITLTDGVTPRNATTAGGGLYSFDNVFGGSYTLSAALPTGMYQTYPTAPVTFDVTSGLDPIVRNFGFNTSDDNIMYRSFIHQDIMALTPKLKPVKAIKRKNDKVEFELQLTVPAHAPADFTTLHIEYQQAPFAETYIKYPGQYFPPQVVKKNGVEQELGVDYNLTGAIDTKNKKYDYVFTSLTAGDVINIHGYVKSKKPIKAKYWWLPVDVASKEKIVKVALLATDPAFLLNQPRLPMPTYINVLEEVYPKLGPGMLIGIDRTDSAKYYGWLTMATSKDIYKTLWDKTGYHDGTPRFFDVFTNNGKPVVKRLKSLPPNKHDNALLAEIIALKIAIDASNNQNIQYGFGELIYDDSSSAYAAFHGKMVKEIAAEASAAMTAKTSTWGDAGQFYYVVNRINGAFAGELDTVSFSGKTVLAGVKALKEVPFLLSNLDTPPPPPSSNYSGVDVPDVYELSQNYPNPFNPTTNIQFILPEDAIVTLKVYNILGQEVATLASKELFTEGMNDVEFDAGRLSSGVYFYHITADGVGENAGKFNAVKKMILMK